MIIMSVCVSVICRGIIVRSSNEMNAIQNGKHTQ